MTSLSDAEIVLGKLGARLIPVVGLLACALPVMSLGGMLGGIEPHHGLGRNERDPGRHEGQRGIKDRIPNMLANLRQHHAGLGDE